MDQSDQAGVNRERADEEGGRRHRTGRRAGALEETHDHVQQVNTRTHAHTHPHARKHANTNLSPWPSTG